MGCPKRNNNNARFVDSPRVSRNRVLINISDIMKVVCCVLALASAVGAKTLTPRSEMAPLLALRGGSCNTRSKMEPLAARLFSAESPLLLCVC